MWRGLAGYFEDRGTRRGARGGCGEAARGAARGARGRVASLALLGRRRLRRGPSSILKFLKVF